MTPENLSPWSAVEYALQKHYHNPDLQAARALYSAAAIHRFHERPPVWIMLIGPPGSMKTELLNALRGMEGIFPVDCLTRNTFLSGQIGTKNAKRSSSLLNRIGTSGIITFPDFSTVLGLRHEESSSIFAACRRIYDGAYNREYGTAEGDTEWEGFITFLAACTDDIEKFHATTRGLGERFTQICIDRGSSAAAKQAVTQDKRIAKAELREAVHKAFSSLPATSPSYSEPIVDRVVNLAEFVVHARTYIHRDAAKMIDDMPRVESATRLAQVLIQLGKGSALLCARDEISEEDMWMMSRVAFDSIPRTRRNLLLWLLEGMKKDHPCPVKGTPLTFATQELHQLGLVADGQLTKMSRDLLNTARITPAMLDPAFYNQRDEKSANFRVT